MHDRLLKLDELSQALGGIGRASIYRHIKNVPGFPQPVKIGAATRFRQSDVEAFISRKWPSAKNTDRESVTNHSP